MHRLNRMVLVATLAIFVATQTFCLVAASYAEGGSSSLSNFLTYFGFLLSKIAFPNVDRPYGSDNEASTTEW